MVEFVKYDLDKVVVKTANGDLKKMGGDKLSEDGDVVFSNLMKMAQDLDINIGSDSEVQVKLKTETKAKLCFLIDCTMSMSTAIAGVRDKINEIINDAGKTFPKVDISVGLVGYRDYGDTKQFELCPFGTKENLRSALSRIEASGGGDFPEDVLGGMDSALNNLNWDDAKVKCIIHIGDAPHHGTGNYDEPHKMGDNYPEKEHLPRRSSDILRDYASKHIDYYFLAVPHNGVVYTEKMSRRFKQEYNAVQARKREFTIRDVTDFTTNELFRLIVSSLNTTLIREMSVSKLRMIASKSVLKLT